MIEKPIIITNNSKINEFFNGKYEMIVINGDIMEVFLKTRDLIHIGHRLLTHPLSGSVKPGETPFKTILVTKMKYDTVDYNSVILIENSIAIAEKLIKSKGNKKWSESILEDFRIIDFDLIINIF